VPRNQIRATDRLGLSSVPGIRGVFASVNSSDLIGERLAEYGSLGKLSAVAAKSCRDL